MGNSPKSTNSKSSTTVNGIVSNGGSLNGIVGNGSAITPALRDIRRERLAAAAAAAAEQAEILALPGIGDPIRDVEPRYYPEYAGSEVLPGLFQGGTEDDDVVYYGRYDLDESAVPYTAIVTMYATAMPAPWGVEELRFGFMDADLQGSDIGRVIRTAEWAFERWIEGGEVLIRCQAGCNRSGLVMALVLIQAGFSASEAIMQIRDRRGEAALFNQHFVEWLLEHGEAAVAAAVGRAA